MVYQRIVEYVLSGEVPQAYTTLKTGKQPMGILRASTRKASLLPRQHSPVS